MEIKQTINDKQFYCLDCGEPFVWAAGEQLYYRDRDYEPPKRCGKCRMKKRQRQNENQDRSSR